MPRLDPVALTADLVRCPSVTPDAGGALDIVEAALQKLGFACDRVTFEGDGGTYPVDNLYARLGAKAPCLLFAGHVDVVPPGDRSRWTVDPFAAEIRDGQLWGRGAVDMKSGIACFIAAVAAYLESNGTPLGSIALAITGDEEAQSINGTVKLLRWAAERGERWDAALVGEPTSPVRLGEAGRIGRRGSLTARLTVHGRQGHTAYPHRADNAAHRLIAALHRLTGERLDAGSEAFEPSNLQVASIDIGNPAANVIPGAARAVLNIRFNDRHSGASLEAWLRRTIAAHAERFDLAVECNAEPFLTQPGRLSETLAAAVEEVTGLRPALNTAGGTSDARFIRPYCPVVEFGLPGTTMHQTDERVALADIEGLTRIYEAFLRRYLGPA